MEGHLGRVFVLLAIVGSLACQAALMRRVVGKAQLKQKMSRNDFENVVISYTNKLGDLLDLSAPEGEYRELLKGRIEAPIKQLIELLMNKRGEKKLSFNGKTSLFVSSAQIAFRQCFGKQWFSGGASYPGDLWLRRYQDCVRRVETLLAHEPATSPGLGTEAQNFRLKVHELIQRIHAIHLGGYFWEMYGKMLCIAGLLASLLLLGICLAIFMTKRPKGGDDEA